MEVNFTFYVTLGTTIVTLMYFHENHRQCNVNYHQVVVMFSSKIEKEQSNALMDALKMPTSKLKVGNHPH